MKLSDRLKFLSRNIDLPIELNINKLKVKDNSLFSNSLKLHFVLILIVIIVIVIVFIIFVNHVVNIRLIHSNIAIRFLEVSVFLIGQRVRGNVKHLNGRAVLTHFKNIVGVLLNSVEILLRVGVLDA